MSILLLVIGIIALIVGVVNFFRDDKETIFGVCAVIVFICAGVPFKKEFRTTLDGGFIYGYYKTNWGNVIIGKPHSDVIIEHAFGYHLQPTIKCYHQNGNYYRSNSFIRPNGEEDRVTLYIE